MKVNPTRLEDGVYPCLDIKIFMDRYKHYFAECRRLDGSCFWTSTYTQVNEVLTEAAGRSKPYTVAGEIS